MTKICIFNKNYFHIDHSRFIPFQKQLIGLTLGEVLPQLNWTRKNITKHVKAGFLAGVLKCQNSGMDINKTVIAGFDVRKDAAVYSRNLKLQGRGRYGATPHPKTTLVQFTFIQQEAPEAPVVPPALRQVGSKGDQIRTALRNRQIPYVDGISQALNKHKDSRGEAKAIHS